MTLVLLVNIALSAVLIVPVVGMLALVIQQSSRDDDGRRVARRRPRPVPMRPPQFGGGPLRVGLRRGGHGGGRHAGGERAPALGR